MDLGLHIANFTWSGGSATFVDDLGAPRRPLRTSASPSSRSWTTCGRSGTLGPPEHEMLEAYTALGYLAAVTERVQLLAWVTAAVYREPGLLAKEVTTLDVLSGGRAMLGIGAAWNEEECGRARPALPGHGRALRAARGDPADLPADVERQRRAVCRQALPARPHPQLAAVGAAPAPADPHRRRRREEDAAAGRAVRPGLQPLRQPRPRAQARRAARPLRDPRPRLRRDREDRHGSDRPRRRTARTSTPPSSTCASWPGSA